MSQLDLVIRSQDRVSGTPDDYTIQLPPGVDVSQYDEMYAASVSLIGSRYNIDSGRNTLYVNNMMYDNVVGLVTHDVVACVVPSGNYSPDDLATQLKTTIEAAWTASVGPPDALVVTVTHDEFNHRFSVSIDSAAHRAPSGDPDESVRWACVMDSSALFASVYTFENSLNDLLGFEVLSYPPVGVGSITPYRDSATSSFTASRMHNFNHLPSLLLCCGLCSNHVVTSNSSADVRQGLALVATAPFGSHGVWESGSHPLVHKIHGHFQTLRLYWVNSDGTRAQLNGVNHTIVLRLRSSE